ncbi:MAG TPA: hypothetical protein VNA14_10150 [Mycobacteriales bacterium]|nr:hypothetical protein [Mycobacteriales bacterium]
MRRLLVVLLLAVGLVPVAGGTAWACVCDGYGDGTEQAEYRGVAREARLAYTGLVAARHQPTPPPPGSRPRPPGDTRYTVRVEDRLKGSVAATREIASSSSSCGVPLEPGRRALVVEFKGDGQIGTCDGTTQHRVDERAAIVRDELRRRTLADSGPPAGLGAVAALLAGAALVGWNRLGRRRVVPA